MALSSSHLQKQDVKNIINKRTDSGKASGYHLITGRIFQQPDKTVIQIY